MQNKETMLPFPVAHRDDPMSSYKAGEKAHRTGKAERDRLDIIRFMTGRPAYTSRQISEYAQLEGLLHLDRHTVARRLPEIVNSGRMKRKDFTDGRETLWWV